MSHIPEEQEIEFVKEELIKNIKQFREIAEARIMDNKTWSTRHLNELTLLSEELFKIQIELNNKL